VVRARTPALDRAEAELPLAALATSGIPCLVVSGGHHQALEAICDVIAYETNAQRAIIPGAGHLVQDTGDPFNRRLEAFMSSETH
jgi:pimeloyl-ACP methyl ester carboxylesterase